MEAWPTVAWVLLLTTITDWVKTAQSRDFTMKDIILLHPSTTPYPGGFKCFTCQDAVDNYDCNRWAPDVYCPKDTKYCSTLHMMDRSGESVSVTKRCATLEECLFTGCADVADTGYQAFLSSLRCALPAVRGTSATCWCPEMTAVPFSPPFLLWLV
ncbi:ly6/PLAUR domain-containing protein 6 isoform X2 [Astatotilapia calliptera]|uniref:ly6/PLAUR domain-containing protein 6 isoform X2 n=1 Tax=Astatotilapia calliptera TaxID=8154 RepID=UPI0003BD8F99|nr:ly6/PLAUR domain-containing protein 6 isoform X2 [Astatotilapia calliptera]